MLDPTLARTILSGTSICFEQLKKRKKRKNRGAIFSHLSSLKRNTNCVNLDITNTVGTTKGGFTINAAYKNLYDTILEPWLESFGKVEHKAMYFPIPVGKIDERFIKQHFTIKGGYDQGKQIKSKMIPGDEVHGVASERAIVEVDLIE